jgi:RNA polymerase sigma-70 factor (ECF subfamily)
MSGFLEYYGDALRFAKNLTRNSELAEDIVHNVFLKLNDKVLTGEEKYKSYLFSSVKMEYLTHLAKKKLFKNAGTNVPIDCADWVAGDIEDFGDMTSNTLCKAINNLDKGLSMPLILFAVYDYGHDEIARIMDIPDGTVKSRIHRAKKHLQYALR